MRSQDSVPADAGASSDSLNSDDSESIEDDFEHVLACWPVNHINGATQHVAKWCGWTNDEARTRLDRLRDAGLMHGSDLYRPKPGVEFRFWAAPEDARGLPPIDDERLLKIGIYRCVQDRGVVTYQGERELVVRRRARENGWSLAGIRLIYRGPSPVAPRQLELEGVDRG